VPLDGHTVASIVFQTGSPARIDDYENEPRRSGEIVRSVGMRSVMGAPITVEGRLWGAMIAATSEEPLPPDTEMRLGQFTELMAAAIANTEARAEAKRLTEVQSSLRRVATLV